MNTRTNQILRPNEEQAVFGGLNVIVFGDFNQLKPPSDSYVFSKPKKQNPYEKLLENADVSATQASDYVDLNPLWSHFKIFRLTEIMRQADDKEFAKALARLGDLNWQGLTDRQLAKFEERIRPMPDTVARMSTEELEKCGKYPSDIPESALFVFHTNEEKDNRNAYRVEQVQRNNNEPIETFALDTIKGKSEEDVQRAKNCINRIDDNYEYGKSKLYTHLKQIVIILILELQITKEKEKRLVRSIPLCVGYRYIINENIDVADGLANGVIGILRDCVWSRDPSRDDKPRALYLWLEFAKPNIGAQLNSKNKHLHNLVENDNWVAFEPTTKTLGRNVNPFLSYFI